MLCLLFTFQLGRHYCDSNNSYLQFSPSITQKKALKNIPNRHFSCRDFINIYIHIYTGACFTTFFFFNKPQFIKILVAAFIFQLSEIKSYKALTSEALVVKSHLQLRARLYITLSYLTLKRLAHTHLCSASSSVPLRSVYRH